MEKATGMKSVAVTCPSCGGGLQVPDGRDKVICTYCGKTVLLVTPETTQPAAGTEVQKLLEFAQVEFDLGNYANAYKYYVRVLEQDPQNLVAWLGRAVTVPVNESFLASVSSGVRAYAVGERTPLESEQDRISNESLSCFEKVCGLLQSGQNEMEERILSASAALSSSAALIVSTRVRALHLGDYTKDGQDKLLRFTRCLRIVWEKFPTVKLSKLLFSHSTECLCFVSKEETDPLADWCNEIGIKVSQWLKANDPDYNTKQYAEEHMRRVMRGDGL